MARFDTVEKTSAKAERQPGNNGGLSKQNHEVKTPKAQTPTASTGSQENTAPEEQQNQATEAEKARLASYVETIQRGERDRERCFHEITEACFRIQEEMLYKVGGYDTEAAFFKAKLGFSRAHSLRLAKEGRFLSRLSPDGDRKLLTSDAHCRPLLKFSEADQD